MTRPPIACIVLLMSACGGGGGTDEAPTSASPPAATPAPIAASPTPSPAPVAPAPLAQPITQPAPTKPPPASPPASPPAAPPSVVAPPLSVVVGADVLYTALNLQIRGPVDPLTTVSNGTTTAYIGQDTFFGAILGLPNQYRFSSRILPETSGYFLDASTRPTDPAGTKIGSDMLAGGVNMVNDGGFAASGNLPLGATLATWTGPSGSAELRLDTDRDDTLFRVCWRLILPSLHRLACGRFNRLTAEFRGIYVSDWSHDQQMVWETLP